MTTTTLQTGYKMTEIGVIPEDWEVKNLGEIGDSIIGLTYSPSNVRTHGKLVHRSSNIQNNQLCYNDNVFVDLEISEKLTLKEGDILICVRNGSRELIGKSALIKGRSVGETFGAFMSVFRAEKTPEFVFYLITSDIAQKQINQSLGATINQITNKTLNSFLIPLPPTTAEQQAIATVLAGTDELIRSLSALIAKKRQIKEGAMQELLTGKKRLAGYSGEWEVKKLGEIANFYDNLRVPITESKRESGITPYYGANGIQGYIKGHTHNGEFVLIAEDGANDLSNYPVLYVNGKVWVNNHAHVIQGKKECVDTKYLSYALKTVNFVQVLVGGTRAKLNGSVAKLIQLVIPNDIAEQQAIAEILSDMDSEITALEEKREKYRLIKQGMMQQLLTGKIRIVN